MVGPGLLLFEIFFGILFWFHNCIVREIVALFYNNINFLLSLLTGDLTGSKYFSKWFVENVRFIRLTPCVSNPHINRVYECMNV